MTEQEKWLWERWQRQADERERIYLAALEMRKAMVACADTEEKDERPHCEKLVTDDMTKQCGSERGLKRLKYNNGLSDSIICDRHFEKEWARKDVDSAEPVKTAADDK